MIKNISPYPWQVGKAIDQDSLAVFDGESILGDICQPVCLISPSDKVTETDLANANLIAAAPELLQVCEQTRIKLLDKFGVFGGGVEINEIFDLINNVVDKAYGVQVSDTTGDAICIAVCDKNNS